MVRDKGTTCLFACEPCLFIGWSVLLGIDSQSLWKYRAALSLPFTIVIFFIGKWKATAVKFYSPSLSFLVHFMRCSLPHTILASVPQETLEDFVWIILRVISFLISLVESLALLWKRKLTAYASLSSFQEPKCTHFWNFSQSKIGTLNFYLILAVILFHNKSELRKNTYTETFYIKNLRMISLSLECEEENVGEFTINFHLILYNKQNCSKFLHLTYISRFPKLVHFLYLLINLNIGLEPNIK